MTSLLEHLCTIDPSTVLFKRRNDEVTAGAIVSTVQQCCAELPSVCAGGDPRIFLICRSAAMQLAGLLIGGCLNRPVVLPAHSASLYLEELGAKRATILSDQPLGELRYHRLSLSTTTPSKPSLKHNDTALIFFTSGSTSAPKPIAKRLSQLELEASILDRQWPAEGCHIEGTVSHRHLYGLVYRIVWPILAHATAADEPKEYWEDLQPMLDSDCVLVTSPAHLTRMPTEIDWSQTRPHRVFSAGAPLTFSASEGAAGRLHMRPIDIFGSTETGGIAWRQQIEPASLWTPLPGVRLTPGPAGRAQVRSPFAGDTEPIELSDRLSFEADGGFHLLSRLDRVVKLEGKRVSLPRIEAILATLPEVEQAAAVDIFQPAINLAAAIVLTAYGRDQLEHLGRYRLVQILRAKLGDHLEPLERPKTWRFLESLPTNPQGKQSAAVLRDLVQEPSETLPPHRLANADDYRASLSLEIKPDLVWLKGHFPARPILAGIAQIHVATQFSSRLWGRTPPNSHISRLKFRRPIHPGDHVELHLSRNPEDDTLRFRYEQEGATASEGVIG